MKHQSLSSPYPADASGWKHHFHFKARCNWIPKILLLKSYWFENKTNKKTQLWALELKSVENCLNQYRWYNKLFFLCLSTFSPCTLQRWKFWDRTFWKPYFLIVLGFFNFIFFPIDSPAVVGCPRLSENLTFSLFWVFLILFFSPLTLLLWWVALG